VLGFVWRGECWGCVCELVCWERVDLTVYVHLRWDVNMINIDDTFGASKEIKQRRELSVKELWAMLKERGYYNEGC
jgi:hypothetical protein